MAGVQESSGNGVHQREDRSEFDYEDGNVLAGPLREIFAVDLTAAVGRCVGCGMVGPVAALRVYNRAPGVIARCPGCDAVMLRLVRGPETAWLDLTGTASLRVPLGP